MTYIPIQDTLIVSETNPITQQNNYSKVFATGQTDGTTSYYIDMENYKYLSIQIDDSPGTGTNTYTVEATVQNDGTAQASCFYTDVTNDWFGSASFTTDSLLDKNTPTKVKYVKIKVVRSGDAGSSGAWNIYMATGN